MSTTRAEKPHWGAVRVPFMKSTTSCDSISCWIRSSYAMSQKKTRPDPAGNRAGAFQPFPAATHPPSPLPEGGGDAEDELLGGFDLGTAGVLEVDRHLEDLGDVERRHVFFALLRLDAVGQIMVRQKGQALATVSAPVSRSCRVRFVLTRCSPFSSSFQN